MQLHNPNIETLFSKIALNELVRRKHFIPIRAKFDGKKLIYQAKVSNLLKCEVLLLFSILYNWKFNIYKNNQCNK